MVRKIYLTNMCTDDNKGDLSIIENSIKLLKKKNPASLIIIQNSDYSREDIGRFRLNRFSKKISDRYHGSFFPKVYPRKRENRVWALAGLAVNFSLSLWILLATLLAGTITRNLAFLIPKKHQAAWRDLFESDLVVVKGGSYIYNFGGLKQTLFTYRMLYTPILAILLRKRIVLFGHSIGPVQGRLMVGLARYFLRRADKVFLREKLSYDYVHQAIGLKKDTLGLVPDLAFLADSSPAIAPQEIINRLAEEEAIPGLNTKDVLIGLTARDWWFPGKKNPRGLRENYILALLETIDFLRDKHDAKLLFIPHCLEDLEFVDELFARLRDGRNVHVLRKDYTPDELRNILSVLKMLIGTRIHSTIFALTVGVPAIAIAYEIHKGFGILEMAGQKDLVLDISEIRKEDLISRANGVMGRHAQLAASIKGKVAELQLEIEQMTFNEFL